VSSALGGSPSAAPGARASTALDDHFVTDGRTIEEADILAFASLTGDTHPQHTDPDWAAGSRFGEQIAHGLLVVSCAVGLVRFDPERVIALRRVGDAVFKLPGKVGDTVHVEGKALGHRDVDAETELREYRWKVLNQDGRMVLRMNVEVICRRTAAEVPAQGGPAGPADRAAPADRSAPAPAS
jgi:3-hydroxybutyryl-CoA dehydratase